MKRFLVLLTLVTAFATAVSHGAIEESASELEARGTYAGESPIDYAVDLQFAGLNWAGLPSEYLAGGAAHQGLTYGGRIAFEWMPIQSIGRIGVGVGIGFNGEKNLDLGGGRYTSIIALPLDVSVSYRAAFFPRQGVVPFIKGGVGMTGIKYTSKSGGPDQVQRFEPTYRYGGGLEFCLSGFNRPAARMLDHSMGVNAMFLVAEYARSEVREGSLLNLSHDSFSFGFRFEY